MGTGCLGTAALAALVLSCGHIGYEDIGDGTAGTSEDAAPDARAPTGPPGTNLLIDRDCEAVDGWTSWQGDLTLATSAYEGQFACQICTQPAYLISSLDAMQRNEVFEPVVGATYYGSAWMRAVDGETGVGARAILREWNEFKEGKYRQGQITLSELVPLPPGEWVMVEARHQVTTDAPAYLDIYFTQESDQPTCALLDDLVFRQEE